MKKQKLIMTLVAAFVCLNLVFGINPTKKDFTDNLANNMIKALCRDIALTDSQKVIIQAAAKDYEVKMKDLMKEKNKESKKEKNKDAVLNYRAKLNQLLSKEQKDTIEMKRMQRGIDSIEKNNQK